jgi:hypothetical protein
MPPKPTKQKSRNASQKPGVKPKTPVKDNRSAKATSGAESKGDELKKLSNAIKALNKTMESSTLQVSEGAQRQTQIIEKLEEISMKLDICSTNVAKLFAVVNSSRSHEKTSGTRASPFGRIADEGLGGIALPGSFESGKK